MSRLVVKGRLISAPIMDILIKLKSEIRNGKLSSIERKGSDVRITCPFHKDGFEKKPSCDVYGGTSSSIVYGTYHCFTCGAKGMLWHLVAQCLDITDEEGQDWLVENFGGDVVDECESELDELTFDDDDYKTILPISVLDSFQSYHPYMSKRKLSSDICERFSVKYDPKSECIVFPVFDKVGDLVFLTRRSVLNKKFIIPPDVEKPVYLLNFIEKEGIDSVVVCESQINALYCWSLGYPAIALFGTGSDHQYSILNKSGIRHYILAFDGDDAGDKGKARFIKNMRRDVLIDSVNMPRNKDINDLSKDEVAILMDNIDECI